MGSVSYGKELCGKSAKVESRDQGGLRRFFTLFGLAWQYARSFLIGATIVLFVTFIVFPRIITKTNLHFIDLLVDDKQRRVTWTFWFFLFLMNLSDTLGKWIAGRAFP